MTRISSWGGVAWRGIFVAAASTIILANGAFAAEPDAPERLEKLDGRSAQVCTADDSPWRDEGTVRDGGPMVFNGGGPDRAGGNNFSALTMADDFQLTSPTTIESLRIWTLEFGAQWSGAGTYRIYSNAGGTPGVQLFSGTIAPVASAATGLLPFGYTEYEHVGNLVPPVTLAAGTYWLGLQDGSPCDGSTQFSWETTAPGTAFGAFARRTEPSQCAAIPTVNMGFHMAFQLFGTHPALVYDGGHSAHDTWRNMAQASVAEHFELSDWTRLDAIRLWTGETAPWDGSGTYRIYETVPGSPPGPPDLVASGNITGVTRATTGVTVAGFLPEFEHYSTLSPAPELPPGNYWINIRDASTCISGGTLFWIGAIDPGIGGDVARETSVEDCGGFYAFNTGLHFAYQLFGATIPPPCVTCGDATVIENEPGCGLPFDSTNAGCSSTPPGLYQQIEPGDTVCATTRFTSGRDLDIYSFTLTERSVVTWTARIELGTLQTRIITKTCPIVTLALPDANGAGCTPINVSTTLDPGDYAIFCAADSPATPCGTKYKGTLTAVPTDPCFDDVVPPTALCVAPFSICLDANGQATITAEDIDNGSSDACGDVTLDIDINSFDCNDLGVPVVVTLTVTDENDNQSSCQTTVTVQDCQYPVIENCPSDFSATCNTEGGYNLDYTPDVTDNCGWTHEVVPPNPIPFGTTTVSVIVTDAGGNMDSCTFQVTVAPEFKDPWRAYSIPAEDGWVRETDFVNFIEGPVNSKAQTIDVGDDAQDWGRRGVMSFDTSGIPASATITGARIRLTQASRTGNIAGLGALQLDMAGAGSTTRGGCSAFINDAILESADYHETETLALGVASSFPTPGGNGFTTFVEIDPTYFDLFDRSCRTQFRFGFGVESDNDGTSDYIAFYSGEAGATVRPELIVEYYDDSCTPCAPGAGCDPATVTLWSTAAEDGGLMESHWTSGVGGTANAGAVSSPVGDTAQRQQLQVLLNFDTSAIPADAVITSAELRVYRSSAVGSWAAFGPLQVGMRNPCSMPWWYGATGALEAADFQAFSPVVPAGTLAVPASNTYTSTFLNPAGLAAINRGGPTQMKLFFAVGDDGDAFSDQVQIATGNYGSTSPGRPRLVVTYEACDD